MKLSNKFGVVWKKFGGCWEEVSNKFQVSFKQLVRSKFGPCMQWVWSKFGVSLVELWWNFGESLE